MAKKSISQQVGYIPPGFKEKPATNHYSLDPGLMLLNNPAMRTLRFLGQRLRIRLYEKERK